MKNRYYFNDLTSGGGTYGVRVKERRTSFTLFSTPSFFPWLPLIAEPSKKPFSDGLTFIKVQKPRDWNTMNNDE